MSSKKVWQYLGNNGKRCLACPKIMCWQKWIFIVELIDAFPIGIAPQALNWGEDGFHRLSIQFAYQRYKPIYDGTYDLAAAATSLFGTAAARALPIGRAF